MLDRNFLCLYGVSHEMITPLDVLSLTMELRIFSKLDGGCVVT